MLDSITYLSIVNLLYGLHGFFVIHTNCGKISAKQSRIPLGGRSKNRIRGRFEQALHCNHGVLEFRGNVGYIIYFLQTWIPQTCFTQSAGIRKSGRRTRLLTLQRPFFFFFSNISSKSLFSTHQNLFRRLIVPDQLRDLVHFVDVSPLMETGAEESVQHVAHERPLHSYADRNVCTNTRAIVIYYVYICILFCFERPIIDKNYATQNTRGKRSVFDFERFTR